MLSPSDYAPLDGLIILIMRIKVDSKLNNCLIIRNDENDENDEMMKTRYKVIITANDVKRSPDNNKIQVT